MFKKIKNRKGFTLIELIVVIAILAVLAAIIIPTVSNSIARAQEARDLANARSIYAREVVNVLNSTETPTNRSGITGPDGLTCQYTVNGSQRIILTFSCTGNDRTFALDTTTGEVKLTQ